MTPLRLVQDKLRPAIKSAYRAGRIVWDVVTYPYTQYVKWGRRVLATVEEETFAFPKGANPLLYVLRTIWAESTKTPQEIGVLFGALLTALGVAELLGIQFSSRPIHFFVSQWDAYTGWFWDFALRGIDLRLNEIGRTILTIQAIMIAIYIRGQYMSKRQASDVVYQISIVQKRKLYSAWAWMVGWTVLILFLFVRASIDVYQMSDMTVVERLVRWALTASASLMMWSIAIFTMPLYLALLYNSPPHAAYNEAMNKGGFRAAFANLVAIGAVLLLVKLMRVLGAAGHEGLVGPLQFIIVVMGANFFFISALSAIAVPRALIAVVFMLGLLLGLDAVASSVEQASATVTPATVAAGATSGWLAA